WGIDALVREQTRPHKDLDLVVDAAQLGEAFAALRGLGLRRVPETEPGADRHVPDSLMPHRELVQDAGGRTVDLHPVRSATWLADVGVERAFATGSIGGRTVDCLSVAAQRAAHQGFELAAEHEANLRSIERLGSGPDAP
ncbi:MAG: lincosamide nucleotidyltransferase, partial [Solirubrobacteraceae bacterium]|nr:lincosamide nucleotidyltransferase [Solirubrobacteraceae bacterium]